MVYRTIFYLLLMSLGPGCGSSHSPGPDRGDRGQVPQVIDGEPHYRTAVGLQGVQPYRKDSPYAEQLSHCILIESEQRSCTFKQLPLIGMEKVYPGVDDIMDRVLVSHQWMGKRFEDMLHALPPDVRMLMRSVTAIVLAEDIRPSYFWSLTGAVYIDPYHLWLTNEEKMTFIDELVVTGPGDGKLVFHAWWRYVKDDDFAYQMWKDWDAQERDLQATVMPMAATLFHELAHANDYFPPEEIESMPLQWTVVEARRRMQSQRASEVLYQVAPLTSDVMFELAQAIHRDAELSAEAGDLSAEEVGLAFQMDFANDDYAYISPLEDVAMLFEETMMLRHFGAIRDVAYLARPAHEADAGCDDYKVAWGMRGRLAEEGVRPRAQLVAEAIMPSRQWQEFFDALAPPEFLSIGSGWCQSLITGNDAAAQAAPMHQWLAKKGFAQQRLYRSSR